jgi:hypothetical protein
MSLIKDLTERVRGANRHARTALVAECGVRTVPVYEQCWIGAHYESVNRSIEIGWAFATGANVDPGEVQACLAELQYVVAFYHEEGNAVLANAVTVSLRILQSLSMNDEESLLAVARGLTTTVDVAQAAETMANRGLPSARKQGIAIAEEQAWRERAIAVAVGWQGVADRSMFDAIAAKPPLWFTDWLKRRHRIPLDSLDYHDNDRRYYLDDKLFTGVAFTLNKDGKLKSEVTYREGLPWGPTKEWYRTGQPMVDSTLVMGRLHGRAREWHANGQLAEDGEYEYGLTLWEKTWDENGRIVDDYQMKESDPDYQTLQHYRALYASTGRESFETGDGYDR